MIVAITCLRPRRPPHNPGSARRHRHDLEPGGNLLDVCGAPGGIRDQVKGRVLVQVRGMPVQI